MRWTLPLSRRRRPRPDRPRRRRPRVTLAVQHLENRWLFTVGISNGIVEFATDSSGSGPVGAVQGTDGDLWVTEYSSHELAPFAPNGQIGTPISVSGNPYAIATDGAGNLWVSVHGSSPAIDEFSEGGSQLASYPLNAAALPQGITVAPNGSVWCALYGGNSLGEVAPGGSSVMTFALGKGTRPEDVVVGSDGNLWVTDSGTNQIARVGPGGTGVNVYNIPTSLLTPWWITPGPDGNLWFTESTAGKIARATTGGAITEFSLGSSSSAPKGIVTGPDGNLWFTESGTGILGRIGAADPSASMTLYNLPSGGGTAPMGVSPGPNHTIWLDESGVGQVATFGWLPATDVLTLDPEASALLVGDLNTSLPLDPTPPCNCGQNTAVLLQSNLALDYNSDTVDVRPIIQTTFQTDPYASPVTSIEVTLTWDGVTQTPEVFNTPASPGGDYLLSVQPAAPATATGSIPYEVNIQANLQDGQVVAGSTSGLAFVVVNGSSDPIGRGWSLDGSDELFPDGQGGYFWVNGSGDVRDFQAGSGNTFVSPPDDHGTLVQTGSGTFTYTDPQQEKSFFTTVGGQILLTSVVQPDGVTEQFSYNSSGVPVQVTEPGGWVVTFTYDGSGLLQTINEPGNRDVAITHDSSGDLASATLPDGTVHTYTYDSVGHMLSDSYGNQTTLYTYDSTGALIDINTGQGRTTGQDPASSQGFQTSPAAPASDQGMATQTDPLGQVTTYTYDSHGPADADPDARRRRPTYTYDFSGQPTSETDPLGRMTTYTYQYGSGDGELTQQINPDGGITRYQYNPTYPRGHRDHRSPRPDNDLHVRRPGRPHRDDRPHGPDDDRDLVRRPAPEHDRPDGPDDDLRLRRPARADRADRPDGPDHDVRVRRGRRPDHGRGPDGADHDHGLRRDARRDRDDRPDGPDHDHGLRRHGAGDRDRRPHGPHHDLGLRLQRRDHRVHRPGRADHHHATTTPTAR